MAHHWFIIRLVFASSTLLSVGKFSPKGHTVYLFACPLSNPINSLLPSPPLSTITHATLASVRRLLSFVDHQNLTIIDIPLQGKSILRLP